MTFLSLSRSLGAAALCCLLTSPAAAFAADGEKTPLGIPDAGTAGARAAQDAPASGGGLVRTIVGLAVVLGVIYGLHWVLKQVKASKDDRNAGTGLDSVATLALGPNRSLHLVRAGTELVLVGSGEHGVTPIRTYSEDEARAVGLLADPDADEELEVIEIAPKGPLRHALPALPRGGATRVLDGLRARTVIR